jgi:hypothetical protein
MLCVEVSCVSVFPMEQVHAVALVTAMEPGGLFNTWMRRDVRPTGLHGDSIEDTA